MQLYIKAALCYATIDYTHATRIFGPNVFRGFLHLSFQPHYGPGVDSASNRNEYQEYFLGVKAAGA
jgi:hypothetical protein